MTITVIGIDPSLRATGLARITLADQPGASVRLARTVETWTRRSTGHPSDDLDRRWRRLFAISTDVVISWSLPCELAVIEGPSFGSNGIGSGWDRAGLWWRIVGRLLDAEVPVAVVPPTTRAKWITGRGNAPKVEVQRAVTLAWHPYWEPTNPRDDNESDALVLASMGAQWLGRLPGFGADPSALDRAEWPDREDVSV
jgi:crossover junction endodeoxyribonuclease RuvC